MSCSYYVTFNRKPTDPEWEKKYAAVVALHEAGVTYLPDELAEYFGCKYADPHEVKEALQVGSADVNYDHSDKMLPGVSRHRGDGSSEIEIDLDYLPKDVRLLKVRISC